MARTALTIQNIHRNGLTPSYASANVDGHSIQNGGQEFIHVKTVGTACTVTVETPNTVDGQAIGDRTIVIGTNSERLIGPFPARDYSRSDGTVNINFSAVTAVTIAAFRPQN